MRKSVLGRGLEALISQDLKDSVSETERVRDLSLDLIDPNPNQPRERFDEQNLKDLAASISRHGLLQPVVVRRNQDRYQIVVGERRLRASRIAGKSSVPAIVRDVSDDDSLKLALLENLQREDLNPIEEAHGYLSLRDKFGISTSDISELLGKDRSTIANTIRLLNLPAGVIELLEKGSISAGHARAILAIEGDEARMELARQIAEFGYSVREIEQETRKKGKPPRKRKKEKQDPQIAALEDRAELHLGTRVRIAPRRKGGVITIEYFSADDLEAVLSRMGVDTDL